MSFGNSDEDTDIESKGTHSDYDTPLGANGCSTASPCVPPTLPRLPPANHITRNDETKRTDYFSSGFAFVIDEFLLAFESPAVTAQTLIFTHDAMARNHERDWISRASTTHSTYRARFA